MLCKNFFIAYPSPELCKITTSEYNVITRTILTAGKEASLHISMIKQWQGKLSTSFGTH
jgi:hypothetical protein